MNNIKKCTVKTLVECSGCKQKHCEYINNLVITNKELYMLYHTYLVSQCRLICGTCQFTCFCNNLMENVKGG